MTAAQPLTEACLALSGEQRRWRAISPTAHARGSKRLAKLQRKQKRQLEAGKTRDARRTARLIAASWDVRYCLAIEECRKHNRKALAQRQAAEAAPVPVPFDFLQQLQQSEIAAFDKRAKDHHEELRRGEIVVEDDIVLVGDGAPTGGHLRRRNATDARALAERLDPGKAPLSTAPEHKGRHDRYTLFPVKKGQTFRPMHAFGMFDRVRQKLLLEAYGGLLETSQASYSGRGKGGHHAAIRQIEQLISDPKIRCVATLDLKSAYPSMDREWLKANLPIPAKYITSTILLEDRNEPEGHLMADACGTARTRARLKGIGQGLDGLSYIYAYLLWTHSLVGLPQGAATSTAIANHVISIILKDVELPVGVRLVNVADDFAVLGPSFAAVDAAVETLCEAFASHPAGSFVMHRSNARTLAAGFEFLGMSFRRRKGTASCEPDDDCKHRGKLRILRSALLVAEGKAEGAHLRSVVAATLGSFGNWQVKNNWVWSVLRSLAMRSSDFRSDVAEILSERRKAAENEIIIFCS